MINAGRGKGKFVQTRDAWSTPQSMVLCHRNIPRNLQTRNSFFYLPPFMSMRTQSINTTRDFKWQSSFLKVHIFIIYFSLLVETSLFQYSDWILIIHTHVVLNYVQVSMFGCHEFIAFCARNVSVVVTISQPQLTYLEILTTLVDSLKQPMFYTWHHSLYCIYSVNLDPRQTGFQP